MNEEAILEQLVALNQKVDHLQSELDAAHRKMRVVSELTDDLTRVGNDLFGEAVMELETVSDHFTYEDLLSLMMRMLRNTRNLERMLGWMESGVSLFDDAFPIANEAMIDGMHLLEDMENKGYFELLKSMKNAVDLALPEFTPESSEGLGNLLASMLIATAKVVTPEEMKNIEKVGLWRLYRESRRPQVRSGMALGLRLLAHADIANPPSAEEHNIGESQ